MRRAALDDFGMQLSARYADLASTYGRCVTQRNALLKETWCCREMLGAWNDSIARAGSALLVHRLALLDRLAGHVHTAYGQVASGEAASVTYASTLGDLPQGEDREELKGWAYERMLAALDEHADDEIRRGAPPVHLPAKDSSVHWCCPGRWPRLPWLAMSWAPPHCCFWTT